MLARTHLTVNLFLFLTIFPRLQNPLLFLFVSLFATAIPDIDTPFSKIGRKKLFRIFNLFAKHRGAIHSLTFLFLLGIPVFLFARIFFLPFVFGYLIHLILDAFTLNGIRIFYPLKFRIRGIIKTGGFVEWILFLSFLIRSFGIVFVRII